MLKTTRSIGFAAKLKKTKIEVDGNNIIDNGEVTYQISSIKGKN